MTALPYLAGYPNEIHDRALELLQSGELKPHLDARYPNRHSVRSSKDLKRYVMELKQRTMRTAPPLGAVLFDARLHAIHGALGLNTTTTLAHGGKLRKRREVRIASLFKETPPEFLRMVVVHELAHMKHADHDRQFYKLCRSLEPDYDQLELDLRLYLTAEEWRG